VEGDIRTRFDFTDFIPRARTRAKDKYRFASKTGLWMTGATNGAGVAKRIGGARAR
jgi:hypothetical protein